MTDFDRKRFVTEAIYTAGRMMLREKYLNDDYYDICIEQTLKYDLEIIEQALKNWVIYNLGGDGHMPQVWQLVEACKSLVEKNTSWCKLINEKRQIDFNAERINTND